VGEEIFVVLKTRGKGSGRGTKQHPLLLSFKRLKEASREELSNLRAIYNRLEIEKKHDPKALEAIRLSLERIEKAEKFQVRRWRSPGWIRQQFPSVDLTSSMRGRPVESFAERLEEIRDKAEEEKREEGHFRLLQKLRREISQRTASLEIRVSLDEEGLKLTILEEEFEFRELFSRAETRAACRWELLRNVERVLQAKLFRETARKWLPEEEAERVAKRFSRKSR